MMHRSSRRNRRPSTLVFNNSRLGVPTLEKKSSSDPELGGRTTVFGHEGGLPPGLTVDELSLYRRRRPPSHLRPQDNLRPEEGSLKAIKSEYNTRYKPPPYLPSDAEREDHLVEILGASEGSLITAVNTDRDGEHQVLIKKGRRRRRPEDGLKLEGETLFRPEYHDTFVDFPRQRPKVTRPRTHITAENHKQIPMDLLTEKNAQYVFFDTAKRSELARRPTILRNEGELLVKQSELHSQFVPHEGAKKADLARRKTSLRMEGDIETKTEQKEKFTGFTEGRRAELAKRRTQLSMEGEMDTLTENNEKYINYFPYSSPKKFQIKKRPTNLKLEGEMLKVTENADNYIEFIEAKRSEIMKRSNNLSLEGPLELAPEYRETYIDFPRERPVLRRPSVHLKQEGELNTTTEKSSQFIDYVSGSKRTEIARKPTNLSLEGEIESKPEYRESFVDFPRQRPKVKKPDASLKPEGEIDTLTEKEAQFVPFSNSERSPVVKRPPVSLRLEGEMQTNPEYKESYVNFPRERPTVRKPTGQLQSDKNTQLLLTADPFKRPRGPGRPPDCNLRSDGRIDSDPEYRSSFVDLPRERPVSRRPQGHFKRQNGESKMSDSQMSRSHSERRHRRLSEIEGEHRRTFVDYTSRERTPSRRRRPEDSLNVVGSSSLVAALSSPRASRRISPTTRVVPPAQHHVAQPIVEPRQRSKTVTFELGGHRPRTCPWSDSKVTSRQDTESEDSLPVESDEPSFRLHVMNVDETCDENDDFARRRRRGRRRRASRISVKQPVVYPLRQAEQNNNPAFVVLDDLNNNSRFSQAATAIPRSNFLEIPPSKQHPRRGGGHHVTWMPPWHDAPTSI
ncbi:hypothetical protein C0J52_12347 [Blattella germanica]|nr:hypothetical protein C0J52_12347 [Blattella germanica]